MYMLIEFINKLKMLNKIKRFGLKNLNPKHANNTVINLRYSYIKGQYSFLTTNRRQGYKACKDPL